MKTEFELQAAAPTSGKIRIITTRESAPYIAIEIATSGKIAHSILNRTLIIEGDDMKQFALNILKALKHESDHSDEEAAFEAAREGGIRRIPVVIDQYGSVNIEEHFVADKYPTFTDYLKSKQEL